MDVYATIEDLEAGWMHLHGTDISREVAETMLKRASAYITALLSNRGIEINKDDEVQMTNLMSVTCSLVRRGITDMDKSNISSIAQTVGSTNVSISYKKQDGSFYLTDADKFLLGIKGTGKVKMMRAAIHEADGSLVGGW